jgi:hypothetical protein
MGCDRLIVTIVCLVQRAETAIGGGGTCFMRKNSRIDPGEAASVRLCA